MTINKLSFCQLFLYFSIFFSLIASEKLSATHYRAGEITYKHAPMPNQKYRFEFNVYTYTRIDNSESLLADRDTLEINWGDGTSSKIPRVNGPTGANGTPAGENIDTKTRRNIYRGFHTYGGANPYFVISVIDPNRIENIVNINFSESVNIPFVLVDTLFLLPVEVFGYNNSPVLSQPPIDLANRGYPYIHNPNANDPDGDSLHFSLVTPLGHNGENIEPVLNYQLPNEVVPINNLLPPSGGLPPGPDYLLSINSETGELLWENPWQTGIYNIAILIKEYRSGVLIGTMLRDMQITVLNEDNRPPIIDPLEDVCITVGETLTATIIANDVDDHLLTLTATGAPFEFEDNPAVFLANPGTPGFRSGDFAWTPDCSQILSVPYTVVFKATDNYISQNSGAALPLSDLETWRIRVVAPPPSGIAVEIQTDQVVVSWDEFYSCSTSPKFRGFSIWRRLGCQSTNVICGGSPEDYGFTLLEDHYPNFSFTDTDIQEGQSYTYLVTGEFSDLDTSGGTPLNFSYSYPAISPCSAIPYRLPLMLKADVLTTDANGQVQVGWSRPNPVLLDTIANPGPYKFELLRSIDNANESLIHTNIAPSFSEIQDTSFLDQAINTTDNQFQYRLRFYSNNNDIGTNNPASTIRLSLTPQDQSILISWQEQVPWTNYNYKVYRTDDGINYNDIALLSGHQYLDENLINGKEYCYYIEGYGSYYNDLLPSPLINKSQIACAKPKDLTPPCPPTLLIENDCENEDSWALENRLSWYFIDPSCALDATSYQIFYRLADEPYTLIATVENTMQYTHILQSSIEGCYRITAVDSLDNISMPSNEICIENCAKYVLPNAFSPNSDDQNDLYTPRPGYRFVVRVEFEVFHRWGESIYYTEDVALNWDGKNRNGKDVPEGVYYYKCKVFQGNSTGVESLYTELDGFIHLFRNPN